MATYYEVGYRRVVRTREEAEQLVRDRCRNSPSGLDAALAEIKPVEIDAEPLHVSQGLCGWSVWSDGAVRRLQVVEARETGGRLYDYAVKLPSPLTSAAAQFLAAILGADGARLPAWAGLVRDARELPALAVGGDRGWYARERLLPYNLTMADGGTRRVFVCTAGYFEGYEFTVYESLEDATREMTEHALAFQKLAREAAE